MMLIRTFAGLAVGWFIGLIFPDTVGEFISWTGLDFKPWQLGAMTGFIGGAFKSWQWNIGNDG